MNMTPLSGGVVAWGDNSNGQLGDGSTTGSAVPVPVQGLPDGVRKVEAGSGHVLALLDNGRAYGWGRNTFGQLGAGTTENHALPVEVKLDGISDIVPGGGQSLFLREDGTVWGSGAGFFGLLGPDNLGLAPVPTQLPTPDRIVSLVSGGGHAVALTSDGTVWTWGRNDFEQLGDGAESGTRTGSRTQEYMGRTYVSRPLPSPVHGVDRVRAVGAGGGHCLAVREDGSLWSWGYNDRGQLGDGTTRHQPAPVRAAVSDVVAVAGAYHHTLALLADGTLRSFGINDCGQLGDGSRVDSVAPVEVTGLHGVTAMAIAGGGGESNPGGYGHNLAVLADGQLWAWGCNGHGELGDGTREIRPAAVRVPGLGQVRHVSAGGEVPYFREDPGGGFAVAIHDGL